MAALRAWYQGLDTREAVSRYVDASLTTASSARSVIRHIRNQLREFARLRLRSDLADLLGHKESERNKLARAVFEAIETLRSSPPAMPQIGDLIERWLAPQAVKALHAYGVRTLTDLTARIVRRKIWWPNIPGLGQTGARQIEVFLPNMRRLRNVLETWWLCRPATRSCHGKYSPRHRKSTARKVHSEAQRKLAH